MRWALVLALLLASCIDPAEARTRQLRGRSGRAGTSSVHAPSSSWSPADISGVELWLHSHALEHMWVEGDNGVAVTRVTADTNNVGQIDDPSTNAHLIQAVADARRPTLSSGSGSESWLRFERAATIDNMVVRNSASAFNFIHEVGVTTIMFHVAWRTDGVQQIVMDSCSATNANRGFTILRTSGNRYQVFVSKGTAGAVYDFTAVQTHTAAMGFLPVVIKINGASGGSIQIGSNAAETFSRTNAPLAGNAFANLTFGSLNLGTSGSDMNLQDVVITSNVVSNADVALFQAWNPARTTNTLLVAKVNSCGYNFCSQVWDYTLASTMCQDAACVTPVAANTDPIMRINHVEDSSGHLRRYGAGLSEATSPIWRSAVLGAEYDPTTDIKDLLFGPAGVGQWQKAGAMTVFIVAKNDDIGEGSHLLKGSNYLAVAGSAYGALGPGESPYWIAHPTTNLTEPVYLSDIEDGWNIIELRRNGSTWVNRTSGINKVTETNATAWQMVSQGGEYIAGWAFEGDIRRMIKINAFLTDDQADVIVNQIKAEFGDIP